MIMPSYLVEQPLQMTRGAGQIEKYAKHFKATHHYQLLMGTVQTIIENI